jgi:ABC-type transporter Mla subunit MlaD
MEKLDSQTVQLIIVAAVAVTMLLQAIALLAIFGAVHKAAQAVPVIDNVRTLLASTSPKIEAAAADLAAVSHNLRRQTADVQVAANGILERVKSQSARLDSMLTRIFDALDHATGFMTSTVSRPMRQLAGLLASAKAVVESLRNGAPGTRAPGDQPGGDKDMYV